MSVLTSSYEIDKSSYEIDKSSYEIDKSNYEIDKSSYEINKRVEENAPAADEYSEEILCASWVATLAVQQSSDFENRASIPDRLVNVDVELFLRKMYSYQR